MSYEEFTASIQQAVASNLNTGNVIFGIFLFIAIVVAIVTFSMYVRKEYYRKRSEIDAFMMEGQHKADIYVPGLEERINKKNQKKTLLDKLYKLLNRD